VDLINETTGRSVRLEIVSPDDFVKFKAADDEGGKSEAFFRSLLTWYESISKGEVGTTDPLMAELLGRPVVGARDAIRGLLKERDYEWHQNYVNRG
jgi:hypothetical protein